MDGIIKALAARAGDNPYVAQLAEIALAQLAMNAALVELNARIPAEFPFTVAAGKYDGHERNCKYVEDFSTFEAAFEAYRKVSDYPWAQIEYKGSIFMPK